MKKRAFGLVLVMLLLAGVFVGCDEAIKDSTDIERERQEELMKEAGSQVGMPNISNFFEKKLAKKIFELRDDSNLITYAYTQNMDGKYVYLGTCIGYGLPYSTQYTNPERIEQGGISENRWGTAIAQADPNGLYSSDGLSATWLVLLDEETGEQSIIYAEPEIVVTQNKLPRRLVEEWSLPANY